MNYQKYIYYILEIVIEVDFRMWCVYASLYILLDYNEITECEYNLLYDFAYAISRNHDLAYLEYTD